MKKIGQLLLVFLFAVGLLIYSCSTSGGKDSEQEVIARDVQVKEFQQLMTEKSGVILDVRTEEEVADGHIADAINIDFYAEDFASSIEKMDRDTPVFVYCAAGGRSGKTKNKMIELGFKEVYNLEGGFGAWKASGSPVSKE